MTNSHHFCLFPKHHMNHPWMSLLLHYPIQPGAEHTSHLKNPSDFEQTPGRFNKSHQESTRGASESLFLAWAQAGVKLIGSAAQSAASPRLITRKTSRIFLHMALLTTPRASRGVENGIRPVRSGRKREKRESRVWLVPLRRAREGLLMRITVSRCAHTS
jgi:hypothetical protein